MKINNSNIIMSSTRNYSKFQATGFKISHEYQMPGAGSQSSDNSNNAASLTISKESADVSAKKKQLREDERADMLKNMVGGKKDNSSVEQIDSESTDEQIVKLLRKLMKELEKIRKGEKGVNLDDDTQSSDNQSILDLRSFQAAAFGNIDNSGTENNASSGITMSGYQTWIRKTDAYSMSGEAESTTFSTTGLVQTEDGRSINFSLDLEMSRSFVEATHVISESTEKIYCDPLVINVGSDFTNISDKKFVFDLNNDGNEENISMLGSGSGFLALDANEDGKINNGSELFGAKTGDGFGELSQYDEDENGWIDENDDIFNKLKVWMKNDDGTDSLISLKDADVGAIYTGSVSTEFSVNSLENNENKAAIRSSGIFLKESDANTGTIQHVDFAI